MGLFNNILGQEYAAGVFENILKTNRLAHTYIFAGPEGVGKLTFAKRLAQILLCKEKSGCGQCRYCQQAERLSHPDLRVIEVPKGAKYIPIDAVREMEASLYLKPYQADYKIFIINNAEYMATEAASALLKTLEEPPSYALLILVTARPETMLATVLSRGQLIRFRPLPDEILNRLYAREGKMEPAEARFWNYLADGSIGWLNILKKSELIGQREQLIQSMLDHDKRNSLLLGETIMEMARAHTKKLQDTRENIIQIFKILGFYLRDALILKLGGEKVTRLINQDKKTLLERLKEKYSYEQIIKALNTLQTAERQIRLNVNPNLVLADWAMELAG